MLCVFVQICLAHLATLSGLSTVTISATSPSPPTSGSSTVTIPATSPSTPTPGSSTVTTPATSPSTPTPGSTYTRWGKTSCSSHGTELVYEGYAGGSWYGHTGGAAEYICLPKDPIWGYYDDNLQANGAVVYGAEYQFQNIQSVNYFGKELFENDVPCAVCITKRSSEIMIPGRNQCYDGWTREYHGYLTGGYFGHAAASEFVCMDIDAEGVPNSDQNKNGKLSYIAEASCGSLPCPPYVNGRELTCVVCSK